MDQAATTPGSDMYEQVGGHIASVIRAAEVAAVKLREEAEREARELKSSAAVSAREALEDAHRQADELLAGAREIRERADSDAQARRAEADAQASKVIEAAQGVAARTVEDARVREARNGDAIAQTEQRLRDLAQGLRELADHLDHLRREPNVEEALAEALKAATGPSTNDTDT